LRAPRPPRHPHRRVRPPAARLRMPRRGDPMTPDRDTLRALIEHDRRHREALDLLLTKHREETRKLTARTRFLDLLGAAVLGSLGTIGTLWLLVVLSGGAA